MNQTKDAMMTRLVDVYAAKGAAMFLYELLLERNPDQNISHKVVPTYAAHLAFVDSHPYESWEIIESDDDGFVGSIYVTDRNEIGVFALKKHQSKGYGSWAVREVMRHTHQGTQLLANINPKNRASAAMFEKLGFKLIQHTYAVEK